MSTVKLLPCWHKELRDEFKQAYMQDLKQFLQQQKQSSQVIYPKGDEIFNALNSTPFAQIKVVIIGQDPYHGPNQAHGLCFSVNRGVKIPPSLRNIYKELKNDLNCQLPEHGNLQQWAQQGVLLLNSVLTVAQGQAGSHQGKGWEFFTDKIIEKINAKNKNIVYFLWGAYAHRKGARINASNNLVLKSVHPSPLSAHRGFFGCQHFSQCNNYLKQHKKTPINWQIT